MAPKAPEVETIQSENVIGAKSKGEKDPYEGFDPKGYKYFFGTFKTELKWFNITLLLTLYAITIYAILTFPYIQKWRTFLWTIFYMQISGFGTTAGPHRLWTHRSYKANTALRTIIMLCYSASGHNPLFDWVRDHRIHHKYSDTDADPHNASRGFWFSHVGWLMMKKHPEVIRRGRQVDMTDVTSDPVVKFATKFYTPLTITLCFVVPSLIPIYFWNEEPYYAIMAQCFIRYMVGLNLTWLVNSAAHMFGPRPYDSKILPSENFYVSLFGMGEGWHNYHHTFPWDYRAAEIGGGYLNMTALILDGFAKIGWAYDMKKPSENLIKRVIAKRGDGSHQQWTDLEVPENDGLDLVDDICRKRA